MMPSDRERLKNLSFEKYYKYYRINDVEEVRMGDFIIEKNSVTGETKLLVDYIGNGKEIVIPEGITTIGKDAFSGYGLEKVTFPSSLEIIEANAFSVNNLTSLHFNSPVTICEFAFRSNSIEEITGPIKKLNITALSNNPIMTKDITFQEGLEEINALCSTFIDDSDKKFTGTITLPSTIKKINANLPRATLINHAILINPSMSLLMSLNYYHFNKLEVKMTFYAPEITQLIEMISYPIIYEPGYHIESLKTNAELWDIVNEIINLNAKINPYFEDKIFKQLGDINQEYERINSYKPKYHENFSLSCAPNIFGKTLEVKEKLRKIKEELQEQAKIKETIAKIEEMIAILENPFQDKYLIPDNMKSILNYLQIINDKRLKKKIIKELNDFIDNLKKNADNPLLRKQYSLDNAYQILTKYNQKFQAIKPYHELLMFLTNQIESIKEELEKCHPRIKEKLMNETQCLLKLKEHIEKLIKSYMNDDLIILDDIFDLKRKLASTLNIFLLKCEEYEKYAQLINITENYPTYEEKISEESIPTINEVLEQIYTLIDLYDIDTHTRKEVEQEITLVMQYWQEKIFQNKFCYPDKKSYIGKINVSDRLKFELGILKDLYKIIFNLNNYIENLSFYKSLTR